MSSRQQLSENFYLDEFLNSETAIRCGIDMSITLDGVIHARLIHLVKTVLQPLRDAFGAVTITSGYRPLALNKKINGATDSDHLYGLAADIRVAGRTPLEVAQWIRDNIENFGQVINEYDSWVHVSVDSCFPVSLSKNQCLTALRIKSKTVYLDGLFNIKTARQQYLTRG